MLYEKKAFETVCILNVNIEPLDTGTVKLNAYFSPKLNFHNDSNGLQYAISVDNEKPQIISVNKDDNDGRQWNRWVANDIVI